MSGAAGKPTGAIAMIRSDVEAVRRLRGSVLPWVMPNLLASSTYRVAHALFERGHRRSSHAVRIVGQMLTGAEVHPEADIGPCMFIDHPVGLVVGAGVVAGCDLHLYGQIVLGHAGTRPEASGSPTLGDGVVVFTKASIVGPITVGDGATIGAHALVVHDVPAGARVKGVPAW